VNLLDSGSMPSLEVDQLLEVCASATWAQRVAAGADGAALAEGVTDGDGRIGDL
jgi:hypothetical protein